jgi:hypothetical protein
MSEAREIHELTLRGTTNVPTTLENVVTITATPTANPIHDPTTSAFNRTQHASGSPAGLAGLCRAAIRR